MTNGQGCHSEYSSSQDTLFSILGWEHSYGPLLARVSWIQRHQQQLIQLAAFLTPHTQWFNSQLELTVSSQEYLKELRILLFQRALYKLPSRDVLKKGNYYFFLYNNYICFKSLYAHDKVVCFSAGFSYSVLMWPRFAVCSGTMHDAHILLLFNFASILNKNLSRSCSVQQNTKVKIIAKSTSAADVFNNCHNTAPSFHLCDGLNCGTHCGMG